MADNEHVRLAVRRKDRYKRLIALVYRDGRNGNRWMVRQGHAWHDDRYPNDPVPGRLERQADRRLWAAADPMPPWDWRERSISASGEDRDCSDFETQWEA